MREHYELLRYTQYTQRFLWLSEREMLVGNLQNLHKTCEQMTAKRQELSEWMEKVQSNLPDAPSLRVKLNGMANVFDRPLIAPPEPKR